MRVEEWNSNNDLKLLNNSSKKESKEKDRTLCAPTFAEGDHYVNFKRIVNLDSLTVMTQGEFDASVVQLGCSTVYIMYKLLG